MKKILIALTILLMMLALAACHEHAWKDATCATPKTCTECGEVEGEALGHSWKDATCENPKTCATCGETEGAANGHDWAEANCTTPKTCATCGETEGDALGHTWTDATCTAPKTCATCGETEGEALGHSWVDATCTAPKTCATCGETEGDALGHTWTDATCTAPKTCSVCGKTDGNAKGHSWKDATCTAPKTCKTCGKSEGNKKNHSYSLGTCAYCGENDPNYSSVFARLREYIIQEGEYDPDANHYCVFLGLDYSGDGTDEYSRVGYYYPDDDIITLDFISIAGDQYAYVYFVLNNELDGRYEWYFFDDDDNEMEGMISARTYTGGDLLSVSDHNIGNSEFRAITREMASLMVSILCYDFKTCFAAVDVTLADVGFVNF